MPGDWRYALYYITHRWKKKLGIHLDIVVRYAIIQVRNIELGACLYSRNPWCSLNGTSRHRIREHVVLPCRAWSLNRLFRLTSRTKVWMSGQPREIVTWKYLIQKKQAKPVDTSHNLKYDLHLPVRWNKDQPGCSLGWGSDEPDQGQTPGHRPCLGHSHRQVSCSSLWDPRETCPKRPTSSTTSALVRWGWRERRSRRRSPTLFRRNLRVEGGKGTENYDSRVCGEEEDHSSLHIEGFCI